MAARLDWWAGYWAAWMARQMAAQTAVRWARLLADCSVVLKEPWLAAK